MLDLAAQHIKSLQTQVQVRVITNEILLNALLTAHGISFICFLCFDLQMVGFENSPNQLFSHFFLKLLIRKVVQ